MAGSRAIKKGPAAKKCGVANNNKDLILEAAMELFSRNGYAQTSIRDITAKSGLSTGTLYFHFKNKKDILKEIFMRMRPVFSDFDLGGPGSIPFEEFFRRMSGRILEYCSKNFGFNALIMNEGFKDPELGSFFYEQFVTDISSFAGRFEEYGALGKLRKIDHRKTVEMIIYSLFSLANFNAVFEGNVDRNHLREMYEFFIDFYSKGIKVPE